MSKTSCLRKQLNPHHKECKKNLDFLNNRKK